MSVHVIREIVFDTETTGFGSSEHRIIEIGCLELVNRLPTGRTFHHYLQPDRDIDFGAQKVHGITAEKLAGMPRFADIAHALLDFIGESTLVAHNAAFDMDFLNAEFGRLGIPPLANPVVDTLEIARRKLPGQRHGLDSLCRTYSIDNSARTFHGALLDAQLLAEVYTELQGGLQGALTLENIVTGAAAVTVVSGSGVIVRATQDEKARHQAFLQAAVTGHRWPTEEPTG